MTGWRAAQIDFSRLSEIDIATANQTRLGLRIAAGKVGAFTVSGNVEVDFYGGGAENKAFNYMRHAYLELKNDRWSFIAGQYWDIINPLNPFTLNYPVLWGSGNIGYRRPQLRVQHTVRAGKALTLSRRLSLIGEFYNGKNMQAFFGGIVQSINTTLKKEIDSMGFYVTLQAGLSSALKLNLGFAHDKSKAETLSIGLRSQNQTVFANLVYTLNKAVSTGFEVLHVSTDYLESTSQKSLRFQHSWILNF